MRKLLKIAAGALALTLSASMWMGAPAHADEEEAWGYGSTPKNADGSLDFSGWSSVGALEGYIDSSLGTTQFTRNDSDYQIELRTPVFWEGTPMLVSNVVVELLQQARWTYSFSYGSGSTSDFYTEIAGKRQVILVDEGEFFVKYDSQHLAAAFQGKARVGADVEGHYDEDNDEYIIDSEVEGAPITYSEVVDVDTSGRILHNVTFTNSGDETITDVSFSALIDTMLNSDDWIPIMANGTNSVYIQNGSFRIYFDMFQGDQMLVGDWENSLGPVPVSESLMSPNGYAKGAVIADGMDTAVNYAIKATDLTPGKSVSMSYAESLYAPEEICTVDLQYIDRDNGNAVVTPIEGTEVLFEGVNGTRVGVTDAAITAGIPEKYVLDAIDNHTNYQCGANQVIRAYLRHTLTEVGTHETTRTVTYAGAGNLTPKPVVQTLAWTVYTDDITGATVWVSESGYAAVASQSIEGYKPNIAAVGATDGTTVRVEPTSTEVTVTYAPAVKADTGGTVESSSALLIAMVVSLGFGAVLMRRYLTA
ncbi:MAG: hypothetical protein LBG99_06930 [Propionibacteriaceae bacterium]|jgi:hypothetical protein|nr:hypothetical protein [Propionibacteriaceae bacterium]